MIDPFLSVAFSMHSGKGVYALLLGSGISYAASIPTGWDIVLDLTRKLAQLQSESAEPNPAAWYHDKYGQEQLNTFSAKRKALARDLYHQTKHEEEPEAALAPYEEMTGLTLEDVHLAFAEGDWRAPSGTIAYGGPKWAAIAETTISLRDALSAGNEAKAREQARRLEQLRSRK